MWQLELLSLVTPAFGALGRDFIDRDSKDRSLIADANDFYSDIVRIGLAAAEARGEWSSGLREQDVNRLLKGLESRLPNRWSPLDLIKPYALDVEEQQERPLFGKLQKLASDTRSRGLGGYDECGELDCQTLNQRNEYLRIIRQGRSFSLFRKQERKSKADRDKFLEPVRLAATHLMNVYYTDRSARDGVDFNLSDHPSSGMKELANRVYNILERNWQCTCTQKAARPSGSREARLSLIRHHVLAMKQSSAVASSRNRVGSAKYELLLPVCKNEVEWKVTNVEVRKHVNHQGNSMRNSIPVNRDICQWLKDSTGFPVDFMVENDGLWHLKPKHSKIADSYTSMGSLQQLLAKGMSPSSIKNYPDVDTLILCYILANSMLYLYPGSWLYSAWSSNKVYFIRRTGNASAVQPVAITLPYLSVDIEEMRDVVKTSDDHMLAHYHPNILALGIIFLEIATGSVFPREACGADQPSWKQWNADYIQARKFAESLDKRQNYVPAALRKAIWSCINLEPPPTIPSDSLGEEGPIRHYILSCIISPLAQELIKGHKISLDELHTSLEEELKNEEGITQEHVKPMPKPSSGIGSRGLEAIPEAAAPTTPAVHRLKPQGLCLMSDGAEREVTIDEERKNRTTKWFTNHHNVLSRVADLSGGTASRAARVKIAILDSGIELSSEHKELYDHGHNIHFKDWVDRNEESRDDVGHGTHLAVLLRKVAPNAAIYAARVFEKKPKGDKSACIIAEALRHAVNVWGVDIVVMSFGFESSNEVLYEAIQDAAKKGVLMFAAASNGGKNRPDGIAWPAREENVICVHSADGLGNRSNFTPSPKDNMRTMVLGEYIESAWPQKLKALDDHKHMSGTSCAAPIAAGIAAVMLDYSRSFLEDDEWRRLRRVQSIRRMFHDLSDRDSTDGYYWIKHWTLFAENRKSSWIQEEIRNYLS